MRERSLAILKPQKLRDMPPLVWRPGPNQQWFADHDGGRAAVSEAGKHGWEWTWWRGGRCVRIPDCTFADTCEEAMALAEQTLRERRETKAEVVHG